MPVLAHYIPQGYPTDDNFAGFVHALHMPFNYMAMGPSPVDQNWRYYSGLNPEPGPDQNYLYGIARWDPVRPWISRPGAMDGGTWITVATFKSGQWAVATAFSGALNAMSVESLPADAVMV